MKVHLGPTEVCQEGLRWKHGSDEGTAGGANVQQISSRQPVTEM